MEPQLAAKLELTPEQRALGLVTCTSDDALYAALDEGTKAAPVEVVYARSFYAGAAHASGCEDHRLRAKELEAPALTFVAERAGDPIAALEQLHDRAFHVDVDPHVNAVILKRPDHLEAGPIADVRETRISMAAEVALQDASVRRPIEQRAPRFELAHAIGRLLRVELRHPPVVDVLSAAHRVGEMDLPAVAIIDVGQRRRDASLGHHGVRFAKQRLAHEADRDSRRRRFDRGAKSRAACSDHQHVMDVRLIFRHHQIRTSVHTPIEQSRTYRSEKPTANRLVHAHHMCRRLRQLTHRYARAPSGAREI